MNIGILGGGTAGLISALILKTRYPKYNIDIIKSDKIGIIGVGEGSTEHWKEFMDFCNISLQELIKETDATFKYGIMFEGWTKHNYYHNLLNSINNCRFGQYLGAFGHAIIYNTKPEEYTTGCNFKNKVPKTINSNQFHFNTFKLNSFLLKKCKEKEINIIEDEIDHVSINNKGIGFIKGIKKYKYDFYIDCSGFKKLLISKLGAKWKSYKKYLPLNEAIAFPTKDTEEYTPYTLAKAMKAGWMWRIPTQGRWGNGYVFDNNFINAEQAKKECESYLGHKIEIAKNVKFEAGCLEKTWIKNCVAIGLSSNFIEPLEATSIGSAINQSFLLMHLISHYSEKDIELYNHRYQLMMENLRDFVALHYIVKRKDTLFWKSKKQIPETLEYNLQKWKTRLPMKEDFDGQYLLFFEGNFTLILKELGLFDIKSIKKQHQDLDMGLQKYAEFVINEAKKELSENVVSHKQALQLLTNNI